MRSLMLLAAIPLVACSFHGGDNDSQPGVPASGQGTSRTYQVADFTAVALKGSDDADIRVGPAFSVRAEGPSDRLDDLKITKETARFHLKRVFAKTGVRRQAELVALFARLLSRNDDDH